MLHYIAPKNDPGSQKYWFWAYLYVWISVRPNPRLMLCLFPDLMLSNNPQASKFKGMQNHGCFNTDEDQYWTDCQNVNSPNVKQGLIAQW